MLSKKFLNIRKASAQFRLSLYSALIIIPIEGHDHFLNLNYSKLKPNKVKLEKLVEIDVNKSASPLFYRMPEVKKYQQVDVSGKVIIQTPLTSEEKDAYFQLGVVYEGDYKPGGFVKVFLPEWLLKIFEINEDYGLSEVDFHHFSKEKGFKEKSESIRDIKLNFLEAGKISKTGHFRTIIKLKPKRILGFWLRSDGDDHGGEFKLQIETLRAQ